MERRIKKAICAVLLSVLMLGSYSMETLAASQQDAIAKDVVLLNSEIVSYTQLPDIVPYATTFVDASVTISYSSAGMHVSICTGMNDIASVVGVKDIEIQRKSGWFSWETVAVANGGEAYDVTTVFCSLTYAGAIEGETYRVRCTHYGDVDGYEEIESVTSGFKCQY